MTPPPLGRHAHLPGPPPARLRRRAPAAARARHHCARRPLLRRPGPGPPQPADARLRPPPADVLPGHGGPHRGVRQHAAGRAARLPAGAGRQPAGVAGVQGQRGDGQPGQHPREPPGGSAHGRLRPGHGRAARERLGPAGRAGRCRSGRPRGALPAGQGAPLWVVVEVEEAYIHCSKHIPRLAEVPAADAAGVRRAKTVDYFGTAASRRATATDTDTEAAS